jgi:hypothetical protein
MSLGSAHPSTQFVRRKFYGSKWHRCWYLEFVNLRWKDISESTCSARQSVGSTRKMLIWKWLYQCYLLLQTATMWASHFGRLMAHASFINIRCNLLLLHDKIYPLAVSSVSLEVCLSVYWFKLDWRFAPGSVYMGFVVGIMTLRQVFI